MFLVVIRIIIAAGGITSGNIEPSILVGMVVVSCIPTTIASNVVMTKNSGGDEAAAIIEVVIGNVVGSFLSPFLIYAFLPGDSMFDSLRPATPSTLGPMYVAVLKQLGLSALLPLTVGQGLRWAFPKQTLWVLRTFYLAKFCSVALVLVAWYVAVLDVRSEIANQFVGQHFRAPSRLVHSPSSPSRLYSSTSL
jgi:solute carrier family 10 (sodium/bile acid cotransporter), member 7